MARRAGLCGMKEARPEGAGEGLAKFEILQRVSESKLLGEVKWQ